MRVFGSTIAFMFLFGSFCFGADREVLRIAPRIVEEVYVIATASGMPVYEYEVREAVYQRNDEVLGLLGDEGKAKQRIVFQQELKRLIERDLIIDDLLSML